MWENINGKGQEHLKVECSQIIAKNDIDLFHKFILKGNFKFSIKLEIISIFFTIGIASKQKNSPKPRKSQWVHYNSDGELWVNSKYIKRSQELKPGDKMTILGNLWNGFMEFRLNDKSVASYQCEKLIDEDIEWKANVKLCKNNCISLNEFFNEIDMIAVFLSESWFGWDEDILSEVNAIIQLD